jgi:hypothetical protein
VDGEVARVGFVDVGGEIHLIYTAPLSLGATLLDGSGSPRPRTELPPGWIAVAPNLRVDSDITAAAYRDVVRAALDELGPHLAAVLDHWREAIEESTAVFDLLPKYFTTSQVRAVYERLWCNPQDPGNFDKWLHRANAGIVKECDPTLIETAFADASPGLWDSVGLTGSLGSVKRLAPGLVGISPWAVGGAAAVEGVARAVAIAAGEIAYQSDGNKGMRPRWFTRACPETKLLKNIYGPRPQWRIAGTAPHGG